MTDEYNPDTIDSIIQSVCDFIKVDKKDLLIYMIPMQGIDIPMTCV